MEEIDKRVGLRFAEGGGSCYNRGVEPPLAGVPIFAGLENESLQLLLQRAELIHAADGQEIVKEGESGSRFYLLKSGSARVIKAMGTKDETVLATLTAKDFFGEMCILETLPRAATVVSLGESELLSVPSTAFYHLYRARPNQHAILILNIARDLSRRLRRLDEAFAGKH